MYLYARCLTENITETTDFFFFGFGLFLLLFFLGFLLGLFLSGGRGGGEEVLGLGDLNSGREGEAEDVSEGVGDDVGGRSLGGDTGGQGEGGNISDTGLELLLHVLGGDLEDGGVVELAVHVDVHDLDVMLVGLDVELLHQVNFGHGDFLADGQDLGGGDDFELILDDLGGDLEGLEVLDLGGIHTSGSGGESDLDGGDGSSLGLLLDDELGGDLGDLAEFFVGEDDEGLHVVDDIVDTLKSFLGVVGGEVLLADVLGDGLGHDGLEKGVNDYS